MRKGILGSVAALALGAGSAWGQSGPPAPAAVGLSTVSSGVSQASGSAPPPVILPPMPGVPAGGPPVDMPMNGGMAPQPPVPMYPPPGPYGAPLFQSTPAPGAGGDGSVVAPHFWYSFEYLMYFPKSQNVPFPLITSSAPNDNGLLGKSSTVSLLPAGNLVFNATSGFRSSFGFFGDEDRRFGMEAVGFALEQKSNIQGFTTETGGIPTLARPFVNSTTNQSSSLIVGNLFFGEGSAVVAANTQTWGVEANGVINLYRTCPDSACQTSIDFLAGYRFLQLSEALSITSLTQVTQPPSLSPRFQAYPDGTFRESDPVVVAPIIPVGGTLVSIPGAVYIQDLFQVRNRFNGGQVGLRSFTRYGMFSLLLSGKIAFGSNHETVDIAGTTGIYDNVRRFTGGSVGGLFANGSNIGRYSNDEYIVVPEFNAIVGVNLSTRCTATIGYNFLYMSSVVRPGTLINPTVNVAQIPISSQFGSAGTTPTYTNLFTQQEFFLHGLNFGLTWKY